MTSLPTLASFHDQHAGSRCFVVGSAPSLASLDLAKLDGELAFSVNRAYLAARVFARHGRVLANAGHGGRLDVLPRAPYSSLF